MAVDTAASQLPLYAAVKWPPSKLPLKDIRCIVVQHVTLLDLRPLGMLRTAKINNRATCNVDAAALPRRLLLQFTLVSGTFNVARNRTCLGKFSRP